MAKMCQIWLIRSTRGDADVTFGRFFHFLHTKSGIPIKSKFQLNPTLESKHEVRMLLFLLRVKKNPFFVRVSST